jgi:hypothetical protein
MICDFSMDTNEDGSVDGSSDDEWSSGSMFGAETASCAPIRIYLKNLNQFTKTGSGQTRENSRQTDGRSFSRRCDSEQGRGVLPRDRREDSAAD